MNGCIVHYYRAKLKIIYTPAVATPLFLQPGPDSPPAKRNPEQPALPAAPTSENTGSYAPAGMPASSS